MAEILPIEVMAEKVAKQALDEYEYKGKTIREWIDALASAERKRGEWILTEDDNYEYCTCSECGYQNGENWMNGSDIPFCAECGADMRKEVAQ